MADNRQYYYMRLKDDFFDNLKMKLLEAMPDGYLYSNILLKMYLISLKGQGRMMLNNIIPYNATMIATVTGHQVGTVEKALDVFKKLELIEILDNGAIYMLNIQNYIGKSSTEADRKKDYRKRIEEEKLLLWTNEGQMSDKCPDKSTQSIENRDYNSNIKDKELNNINKENNNNISIRQKEKEKEAEELFEKIWKLYPRKKGKVDVTMTNKLELLKIGEEKMTSAVKRYIEETKGRELTYIMQGGKFFKKSYKEYLDDNYEDNENSQVTEEEIIDPFTGNPRQKVTW